MSKTNEFFRKYSDMVAETEQMNEAQLAQAPAQKLQTDADRKSGNYRSDVAVNPGDRSRVQVAPNVQKKVYDYEQNKAAAEKARTQHDIEQHPIWDKIGTGIGDVIGGAKSRWNALAGATSNAIDRQTGADVNPDPTKPVDIIPDPRRGTSTPRESAGDLMRKYADVLNETSMSDATNKIDNTSKFMKVYKQVSESKGK